VAPVGTALGTAPVGTAGVEEEAAISGTAGARADLVASRRISVNLVESRSDARAANSSASAAASMATATAACILASSSGAVSSAACRGGSAVSSAAAAAGLML